MINVSKHLLCLVVSVNLLAGSQLASAQVKLNDGRWGMTCVTYDAGSKFAWRNQGGDWRDAKDAAQGDRPFDRQTVSRQQAAQIVRWDVTSVARRWQAGALPAGGIFLRQLANNDRASVNFFSREVDDQDVRPRLVIDWDDGTQTKLQASADSSMTCSSLSSNGRLKKLHVGGGRATALVFPFKPRTGVDVRRAWLAMVSFKQFGTSSDVGVFRLDAPFAHIGKVETGIAREFARDKGIAAHPAVLFSTGFESSGWLDEWSDLSQSSQIRRIGSSIASQFAPFSGSALEVTIAKGKKMGLNLRYLFKEKRGSEPESAYFRYYLRLDRSWIPREGGKLPGFSGTYNRAGWGGRRSDGTNGWSARGTYMLPSGSGSELDTVGSYVYQADSTTKYGDTWGWNIGPTGRIEKDRWYSIEQYVKLNDPGRANGVLRAWIDGVLVFERSDIRFRSIPDLRIEALWMNVYHGGTSSAPQDLSLYIDNVVVATQYIGPAGQ